MDTPEDVLQDVISANLVGRATSKERDYVEYVIARKARKNFSSLLQKNKKAI